MMSDTSFLEDTGVAHTGLAIWAVVFPRAPALGLHICPPGGRLWAIAETQGFFGGRLWDAPGIPQRRGRG